MLIDQQNINVITVLNIMVIHVHLKHLNNDMVELKITTLRNEILPEV